MGKMSDLDLTLKDLRAAAQSILSAADALEAVFSSPPAAATTTNTAEEPAATTPETVPATESKQEPAPATESKSELKEEKPISIDDVRTVLAGLSNDGKKSAVKKLLAKYGSSRLSEIDPKNYAALLKDAEEVKNAE